MGLLERQLDWLYNLTIMAMEFDEESFAGKGFQSIEKRSFSLANFLVRKNIIKNENTASWILVCISLIILIVSIIWLYNIFNPTPSKVIKYSELPIQEKLEISERIRSILENRTNNTQ